jgi:hypothetical protein
VLVEEAAAVLLLETTQTMKDQGLVAEEVQED